MPTHPLRDRAAAVRAYCDHLRHLMTDLAGDPLSESRSLALITHIVTGRALAARPLADTARRDAAC